MDQKNKEFFLKYQDLLFFLEDSDEFTSLKQKCNELRKAYAHELELAENAKNQAKGVK